MSVNFGEVFLQGSDMYHMLAYMANSRRARIGDRTWLNASYFLLSTAFGKLFVLFFFSFFPFLLTNVGNVAAELDQERQLKKSMQQLKLEVLFLVLGTQSIDSYLRT